MLSITSVECYEVVREIVIIQKGLKATRVTLGIHVPHLILLNHSIGPNALFPPDFPRSPHGSFNLPLNTQLYPEDESCNSAPSGPCSKT